ncbi:MAG: DnaJ domain-containing protein [Deltaproteobacteria bacterium]|nr:DnaJ domain-containing protein [Deltaproteobacteria bacterium]
MQAPPPAPIAPTAQGSFVKTPFPHLLIYALERGLNGTFELHVGAENVATMLVVGGAPAKLRTNEGVHYLGDVMVELGLVAVEAHQAALARMQESPRLYGQLLKEMGAVDDMRLEGGVKAQLERKVEHLFSLPSEASYAYYDQVDNLARYGGPPTPIDPLPILWRGVRQSPAWEHVDATLRRVGGAAVRIAPNAQIDRFQFTRAEVGALELLRQRPMRVVDLANAKVIGPSVAQLLVYLLVITKQVDLVENTATAGRPPTAPGAGGTPAAGTQPGQPGQAFARVQLQAKQVARVPLVVEEAPVVRSSVDNRIASPMPGPIPIPEDVRNPAVAQAIAPAIPQAPPAPTITGMGEGGGGLDFGAGGLDIGAMISTTINSSMPPPLHTPGEAFAPAPPPSSHPAAPPSQPAGAAGAPSSQSIPAAAPLTAEQSSLKQKIVERAAQISGQDYFQMLGLDREATPEQVQKAFFNLAKIWHPDRLPPALVDVKDACSKVFTHLTDAQQTLCDPEKRADYMKLLKEGGATPDDQAKIQAVLEAAMEFQKAEVLLRRNDLNGAYEIAKRCLALDPEQADYLAVVTWIDAQKPEWTGREKTLEKIAVLDRCIKMNEHCERAYFFRGMLYKRIEEHAKAFKDFKKSADMNPRNLDAAREVRLHNMRGNATSTRPSGRPGKPAAPETLGGLFGKLFKK